ncbi:hypothetical protein [Cystobacter fuscus]|uniref:hypothetical protein n=1 Tax=Cystobacter fuscus TaxID=43 RepID=UPI002B2801C8|nr:hypothetical protein F0U63_42200 [Cystobacter fuscus]
MKTNTAATSSTAASITAHEDWLSHIRGLVKADAAVNERILSLTANENTMSRSAMELVNYSLGQRYHLGDGTGPVPTSSIGQLGELQFRAFPGVLSLEKFARDALCEALGAASVDFRPLSGVHAMMSTLLALSEPGDLVLSLPPEAGGHHSTAPILLRAGRRSGYLPWNHERQEVDIAALRQGLSEHGRPRIVFLDPSICLFPLNLRELRAVLGSEPLIAYDGSHPLGLILGGVFQSPLEEGCDVVQGNTHKSLPGPHKAIVATKSKELGDTFRGMLSEALVSSQHTNHSLALYWTLLEMKTFGRAYALQVQSNAQALARALTQRGFKLFSRNGEYTRSHMLVVTECPGVAPAEACRRLIQCSINANSRPWAGRSILRLGVQEVTRRGMKEQHMDYLADLIANIVEGQLDSTVLRAEVERLREDLSGIHYSFDSV